MGIALSIRNPEVAERARELARRSGQSMSSEILAALDQRLEQQDNRANMLRSRIKSLAALCAQLPDLHTRSADEILGWNIHGLAE